MDKLLSVLTLVVAAVFGLQALGLDVNSVLAIGGVGGLAVGLAGREILENLFTGLIILSSNPFEVGVTLFVRLFGVGAGVFVGFGTPQMRCGWVGGWPGDPWWWCCLATPERCG